MLFFLFTFYMLVESKMVLFVGRREVRRREKKQEVRVGLAWRPRLHFLVGNFRMLASARGLLTFPRWCFINKVSTLLHFALKECKEVLHKRYLLLTYIITCDCA